MGEVYFRDSQGRLRGFKISGDTPTPDEERKIGERLNGAQSMPSQPEDNTGIIGALGAGIGRGWNSSQAGIDRIGETLAVASPSGYFGGYTPEEWAAAAASQTEEGGKYYSPQGGFFDQDGFYAKSRFLANVAGQTIPSMVAGIGAGVATGNPFIGATVGSAAYLPQSFDEAAQAQIQQHGRIKNYGKMAAGATFNAAIEGLSDQVTAGLAGAFKSVGKPFIKEAVKAGTEGAYKVAAKKLGAAAAIDAIKGAGEEVTQSIVNRVQAEMPIGDEAAQREYIESAVVGGLLEGIIGGGAGVVAAKNEIQEKKKFKQLAEDINTRATELVSNRESYNKTDMPSRMAANSSIDLTDSTKNLGPERRAYSDVWKPVVEQKEKELAPFTEEEYKKAVSSLANEKLISVDKIKRKAEVSPAKAKEIFKALRHRGDANPAGSNNTYLRIVQPADRPAGVETKHLGAPAYRSYSVSPIDPGFNVIKDGNTIGSFKDIGEAHDFVEKNGFAGISIEEKPDRQYGIYEVISSKSKTKPEAKVEGKRLVNAFATEAEAKSAALKLDPKYSPESNALVRKASEEEKVDLAAASLMKEMGDQASALQKVADNLIGAGRANVGVVPTIDEEALKAAGVRNVPANMKDLAVEGATTQPNGMSSLITLAQDVSSPTTDPLARQEKLRSVLNHEIVHAIRNSDLLTEAEWGALYNAAMNDKVPNKRYTWIEWAAGNSPDINDANILFEEAVAEMVRAHLDNPLALKPKARGIIGKIVQFLKNLGRATQGKAAEEVIDLIRGGAIAKRNIGYGGLGPRGYPGNPMFAQVPVKGFYLKSFKVADSFPREKASPDEWLAIMSKGGVKPEEMKWLGLDTSLRQLGKSITKGEMMDYIKANSIEVKEEINKEGDYKNLADKDQNVIAAKDSATRAFNVKLDGDKSIYDLFLDKYYKKFGEDYDPQFDPDGRDSALTFGTPMDQAAAYEFFYTRFNADLSQGDYNKINDFLNEYLDIQVEYGRYNSEHAEDESIKYRGITQTGLKNYGELAFYLPGIEPKFESTHFDDANVVAHARFGETELNGRKTLDIQEWQSDWHQKGRNDGYEDRNKHKERVLAVIEASRYRELYEKTAKREGVEFTRYRAALNLAEAFVDGVYSIEVRDVKNSDLDEIVDLVRKAGVPTQYIRDYAEAYSKSKSYTSSSVPDAPFKKTWDELAYKRLVQYAIDNGLDAISFNATPEGVAATEKWGELYETLDAEGGTRYIVHGNKDVTGIVNSYTKVMRNKASEFAKRFGEQLVLYKPANQRNDLDGSTARADQYPKWVMPINDAMRAIITKEGQPLFSSVNTNSLPQYYDRETFLKWFKNSKVVREDGSPLKLFHFTDRDFEAFDTDRGMGTHFGTAAAARERMQGIIDDRFFHGAYNDETRALAAEKVREYFSKHSLQTIPVWLSIQNPMVIDNDPGNWNDSSMVIHDVIRAAELAYHLSNDPMSMESYKLYNLVDNLKALKSEIDEERVTFSNDYIEEEPSDDARYVHEDRTYWTSSHENERFVSKIKYFLQIADFDGIQYTNFHEDSGSKSWIIFNPEQAKSVHNMGTFDPNQENIMFSAVPVPQFSATAPMGQRVNAKVPAKTLAQIEAGIRYNLVAPYLQKLSKFVKPKYRDRVEGIIESSIITLQDRMLPMGKLVDRIRANGGFVTTENDPYLKETLISGKIDYRIEKAGKEIYEPLFKTVKELPVTEKDANEAAGLNSAARAIVGNYIEDEGPQLALAELALYALHAKERNAVMRQRNENLIDERQEQADHGSGMMDAEADEILNWFASKQFGQRFTSLSDPASLRSKFRGLIRNTNETRKAGGLIPEYFIDENGNQIAEYDDYAPLRSLIDEHNENLNDEDALAIAATGKGFKIHGKEDKSALGRKSLGSHLIAHAVLQNEESIVRSEKNELANSFLSLLETFPNGTSDVAKIVGKSKMTYAYDPRTGQVRRVNDSSMRNNPMFTSAKRGGEEIWIEFSDKRLANTMTSRAQLGNAGAGRFMKMLLGLNHVLAAMRTSHNPEFLVSNFVRDLQTALINISENESSELSKNILKSLWPALKGLHSSIRSGDSSGEWGKIIEEFKKNGGHTAFLGIKDLNSTLDKLNSALKEDYSGADPRRIWNAIRPLRDFVDGYNLIIENGIRLSTYAESKKYFLSLSENPSDPSEIKKAEQLAARAAKEVTINFTRRGEMGPLFNALYLFYNASIQGSLALINPMIRSKRVRKIWGGILGAGMMQDMIMSMISPEDDDGIKTYDKIPDYILEHNLVFMDPFGLTNRGYIKIPLPYLMNGVFNAGRATASMVRGGTSVGKGLASIGGVLFESMSPIGQMNSFANFVSPTVADPIIDLTLNQNFTGAPIMPEKSPYGQTPRSSQRYWNNTSPAYVTVADWISRITGGSGEYIDGLVEVSPNQLDYLVNYITGGVGSFIVRSYDMVAPNAIGGKGVVENIVTGGDWSANDIPFLRRVLGNISSREDQQFYIENRDRVLRIKSELDSARKNGDSARYLEIKERYPKEYSIANKINKIEAARRKLSAQINKIRKAKNIPDDRKRELIDALKAKQQDLIGLGNKVLRTL